jgi:hypothetical protein
MTSAKETECKAVFDSMATLSVQKSHLYQPPLGNLENYS